MVDGIFILIGILAIFLDFYHGSVILSVTGIVLIILGLLGAELINASVVGLIFLLIAAVLIFLELKTQHGIALLAGLITGIIGIYFLASSYYTSNPGYSPSPFGMSFYLTAILIVILGIILILYIRKIIKSYKRKNFTGSEALIGTDGTAVNNIPKNEKGFVSLDGIKWEAINNGDDINANDTITVVGRTGIKLIIKKKNIK
jgi:membrane-bound serine protease (ClpP class)